MTVKAEEMTALHSRGMASSAEESQPLYRTQSRSTVPRPFEMVLSNVVGRTSISAIICRLIDKAHKFEHNHAHCPISTLLIGQIRFNAYR